MLRFCLAALCCTVSLATTESRVPFETDVQPSRPGWQPSLSFAIRSSQPKIELSFAVKQTNTSLLVKALERVSDPASPQYGQHLTQEEVHAMVAPSLESIKAVQSFIESHGAEPSCLTPNCDFVGTIVTIQTANRILDAQYQKYVNAAAGIAMHATDSYSLPASVATHVDFVSPTVRLPTISPQHSDATRRLLGGGGGGNTPASLRKLYSIDVEGTGATKQAATGFLQQAFKPTDLQKFYADYYKAAAGRTIRVVGDTMASSAGVEASLDVDYISTVAANVTTEFWSFDGTAPGNPQNEPFLKWIQLVSSTSDQDVPHVFSTSYGEDEASVSAAYADRINIEFVKAGARGISLMFASGDDGVGSDCKDGMFDAKWPAGSPYVTAVGGTEPGSSSESAAGLSSGGFSYRYAQPVWQRDAVKAYLSTASGVPAATKYNSSGRAFPDVSAQAVNFVVVNNGMTLPGVSGTSAACPTFSAVIGLLNDLRAQNGKSSLGFLNPWIYKSMSAFNDISTGSNPGCSTQGFPAAKGWDPATGVGTPNYAEMAKALP